MRYIPLAVATALLAASPAFAAEPAQRAFDLLAKYPATETSVDYIKLQSSIDRTIAMKLDSKFSKMYGSPAVTRGELKVWEVDNPNRNSDQAAFTTIMCGPDAEGGIYISADRRGANTVQPLAAQTEPAVRVISPTRSMTRKSEPVRITLDD